MIGSLMNNELESMWKEVAAAQFKAGLCHGICLEGLKKTTKHFN
jgi:hypothetical protein